MTSVERLVPEYAPPSGCRFVAQPNLPSACWPNLPLIGAPSRLGGTITAQLNLAAKSVAPNGRSYLNLANRSHNREFHVAER